MTEAIAVPAGAPSVGRQRSSVAEGAVADARVLVVDDVPENRELLVRRLSRLGIQDAVEASNGREALDHLDRGRFDLVLLDIMMPVMNGYEVLEALNADGRIHNLPVIVISALDEVDSIASCIEQGAEDFLLKPFNRTLLRARVLSCLEKKMLRDRTRLELQRKQAELAEARILQLALAPPPDFRDTGFGAISIDLVLDPAKEVGGDLVDHFPVGEELHVLLLGDVSDKGAGAALMMARTCALFRALAARPDAADLFASPEKAAEAVNAALAANNSGCMFVTLLLASLDVRSGALRYVRAGHVPPFLRRADGAMERLETLGGLPLGIMEDGGYRSCEATLAPGDVLLAVTDGVSEAAAPGGAMLGEAGAANWLAASGPTPQIADLVAAVRRFEAGEPPSDDLAAIMVRADGPGGPASGSDGHTISLTVSPAPGEVSALVEQALAFLAEAGVDQRAAHHTGLVLDELLTNIGSHGGGADLPCDVRVFVEDERVGVTISDSAPAFDPRSAAAPDTGADVTDRPIGGLGAHLVLNLSEDFDCRREDDRNVTSLWIRRRKNEPGNGG